MKGPAHFKELVIVQQAGADDDKAANNDRRQGCDEKDVPEGPINWEMVKIRKKSHVEIKSNHSDDDTDQWLSGALKVNHEAPVLILLAHSQERGRGRQTGTARAAADWLDGRKQLWLFCWLSLDTLMHNEEVLTDPKSQTENSSDRAVNEQHQNRPSWKILTPPVTWSIRNLSINSITK